MASASDQAMRMRPLLGMLLAIATECAGAIELLTGGAGWALRFDGQNDFVALGVELPSAPNTIEFWAQPMHLEDSNGIVVQSNVRGSILARSSMNTGAVWFLINYNGQEVWHALSTVDNIGSDTIPVLGTYQGLYHYAYVQDPTNISIYINGERAFSSTSDLNPLDLVEDIAPLPWLLGARATYSGGDYALDDRCFGGIIDELRWWNSTRTQEQIRQYMHEPVPANHPDLVQRWSFDAGQALGDRVTHTLGGGDSSRAPTWVPSPVMAYGGPVAVAARAGQPQTFQVCSLLKPAINGVSVSGHFTAAPHYGVLTDLLVGQHFPLSAVEVGENSRYCAQLEYTSLQEVANTVVDEIPFKVEAGLPDTTLLEAEQTVVVQITRNHAPIAGVAKAIETNGRDNYISLGSWNLAHEMSLALWFQPLAIVEDSYILSRHTSKGDILVQLGFLQDRYYFRVDCVAGCYKDGKPGTSTGHFFAPDPDLPDNATILNTGMTSLQIRQNREVAHHVAVTLQCMSLGTSTSNALAEVRMYVDGKLIGQSTDFEACLSSPTDPDAFGSEGYVPTRPAPWKMGAAYDAGALNAHQENVAVVPSKFMHAVFDELTFWNLTLEPAEVALAAAGGMPQPEAVAVHYSFDLDDLVECSERQLWQPGLACYSINEEAGRTAPVSPFTWTNAEVGGADYVMSPFNKVPGSAVHVTMEAGSCASVELQASDPDGDAIHFTVELASPELSPVGSLNGSKLTLCDTLQQRRDVEVAYDACDSFQGCSSLDSGTSKVIFHVLEHGPEIVAFQAFPDQRMLRLAFSSPTNMPLVDNREHLELLLDMPAVMNVIVGRWEEGGQYLQVTLADSVELFACETGICMPNISVAVKQSGMLRDAGNTQFPSFAVSPLLVDATCSEDLVLVEGELNCRSCPVGEMISRTSTQSGRCVPCRAGTFQQGSGCERCPAGQWSNSRSATACMNCLVHGESSTPGAIDSAECFCQEGYYEPLGTNTSADEGKACMPCPGGMVCEQGSREANLYIADPEARRGQTPTAIVGFMSIPQEPLVIYTCRNDRFCPGGGPGTCGALLDSSTVACGECQNDYIPDGTGGCLDCDETGSLIFLGLLPVGGLFGLMLMIYFAGHDKITESGPSLTCAVITGLTFTSMQSLAVFDSLLVEWEDPIKSALEALALVSFDVAFFRVGCTLGQDVVAKFASVQLFMPLCFGIIAMMVLVKKFLWDATTDALALITNAVGSLYLLLFTMVILGAVRPFVCYTHMSGDSSMWSSPAVICFGSDSRHSSMVVISCIVMLVVVLPFLAAVIWASAMYPRYVAGGQGSDGLKRFNFLYRRFTPKAYYFSSILLLRGLSICLVPALIRDRSELHILLLSIILLIYGFVQSVNPPWRTPLANLLDTALTGLLLLLLVMGAVTIDMVVETSFLEVVGTAFLIVVVMVILCAVSCAVYLRVRSGLLYPKFICHHKKAAAAQARHLQMVLVAKSHENCFLDSDHLKSLDALFDIIRTQVGTLVVYLTRETLRRPWCAGEVVTAYRNGVNTVTVITPDFEPIPQEEIQDPLVSYVRQPVAELVAVGITSEDTSVAFMTLFSGTITEFRPNNSLAASERIPDLAGRLLNLQSKGPGPAGKVSRGALLIVSNRTDAESTASAAILLLLLSECAVQHMKAGAHLLVDLPGYDESIDYGEAQAIVMLLTAGSMRSTSQIWAMMKCQMLGAKSILVSTPSFTFPSGDFFQLDLPELAASRNMDANVCMEHLRALFRIIALPLSTHAKYSILVAQAGQIADRISNYQTNVGTQRSIASGLAGRQVSEASMGKVSSAGGGYTLGAVDSLISVTTDRGPTQLGMVLETQGSGVSGVGDIHGEHADAIAEKEGSHEKGSALDAGSIVLTYDF